jgi:NitT/TauT family transport system substrate-binding protein
MRIKNFLICSALFCMICFTVISCKTNVSPSNSPVLSSTLSAPLEVKLGISGWPGYLPFYLSDKKGLLKSNKFNLSTIFYEDYTKSIVDLAGGKLKANAQTLIDTVLSIAEGSDQVVVAVLDHSTGSDKIIAKPGINSVKDLKGKTVAVEKGTVDHYLILIALKKFGLKKEDVKFVFAATDKAAKLFAEGKVDAVGAFAPFTTTALKAGGKELASSKDFPGAISDVLSFRAEFLDKHPDTVQEIVNLWFDTLKYIDANKDTAIGVMATQSKVSVEEYNGYLTGLHLTDVADNSASFNPSDKGSLFVAANSLKKALIEIGLTKNNPDVAGMFDDRFIKAYKPKT